MSCGGTAVAMRLSQAWVTGGPLCVLVECRAARDVSLGRGYGPTIIFGSTDSPIAM